MPQLNQKSPTAPTPVESGERLRLMHVHAHPDDESSKGAASTARYVAEGVEVTVVSCTGGERGDVLNPAVDNEHTRANLAQVRLAEMAEAVRVLGVEHHWLGFIDSGYPQPDESGVMPELPEDCFALVPLETSAPRLASLIRSGRPHVLTTYDENGGYPHPDHIRCHEVSMAAVRLAADPDFIDGQQPWQVHKVYYHAGFHYDRVKALHDAMLAAGMESRFAAWIEGWDHSGDREVTTRVFCEIEHFEVRDAALRAHATQIDPTVWLRFPAAQQHAVWPTEDFELAVSWVPADDVEDDLFAGVRPA
ncbi:MAG: mycothiol conjugate amidase Mca [Actinobacteria bacterium]|nr:mycothiol conjugate amidase Mca [Actinomycetota bacterium]